MQTDFTTVTQWTTLTLWDGQPTPSSFYKGAHSNSEHYAAASSSTTSTTSKAPSAHHFQGRGRSHSPGTCPFAFDDVEGPIRGAHAVARPCPGGRRCSGPPLRAGASVAWPTTRAVS